MEGRAPRQSLPSTAEAILVRLRRRKWGRALVDDQAIRFGDDFYAAAQRKLVVEMKCWCLRDPMSQAWVEAAD